MEHEERLKAALADRYAIEREIGSGGMATVYLAQDLKHERKVAVKVLKPELVAVMGTERFLAEIRTTANLQHPHILPLFDSGEADGFLFYVMPYVEGESLRQKLERNGQLPVEEAVRIAGHVANALDHAHRHNVIHRDIKPANILFHEREPVVADFGIALAVTMAGEGRLTETGLSLGTPYYMSPEQAAGDQDPTAASDVYSLGCVLYEMLTGEPPHTGASAQAILGKILLADVTRPTKLRRTIPANVEGAVLKALERLPADRFEAGSELAQALKDKEFRHGVDLPEERVRRRGLTIGLAGLTVIFGILSIALGLQLKRQGSAPRLLARSTVTLAEGGILTQLAGSAVSMSPDGARLAFADSFQIWYRPLDQLVPLPIAGTEGATNPVFSPDGNSLAFVVQGSLKAVPLTGGVPSTIVSFGVSDLGIDWGPDGMLYFSKEGVIQRVQSTGGDPEPLTVNDPNTSHGFPEALPDGRGLIFSVMQGGWDLWKIAVLDARDGNVRTLFPGSKALYSASGHILYNTAGGPRAAPFDLRRLDTAGSSVLLDDRVRAQQYALSQTGTLLYVPGVYQTDFFPVWVTRDGSWQEIHPDGRLSGDFANSSLSLSPDENRLAISSLGQDGNYDLSVRNLDTGQLSRLTHEGPVNRRAEWSADGLSLRFISNRGGKGAIWEKRVDGNSPADRVLGTDRDIYEVVQSTDGNLLVFRVGGRAAVAGDIFSLRDGVDTEPSPLVVTEFHEDEVSLSPDGHWLAYRTEEYGRSEVYVRTTQTGDTRRWQVSVDGGTEPLWGRDGGELFYVNGASELVSVQVSTGESFLMGQETVLFSLAGYARGNGRRQYDVTRDGQRFVMFRLTDQAQGTQLVLVQNFFEELRRKTGG